MRVLTSGLTLGRCRRFLDSRLRCWSAEHSTDQRVFTPAELTGLFFSFFAFPDKSHQQAFVMDHRDPSAFGVDLGPRLTCRSQSNFGIVMQLPMKCTIFEAEGAALVRCVWLTMAAEWLATSVCETVEYLVLPPMSELCEPGVQLVDRASRYPDGK